MIVIEKFTTTPAAGSAEEAVKDLKGIMHLLSVSPATATTSYDIKFTDANSVILYEQKGLVGTTRDNTQWPIKGATTMNIDNASADELFTISMHLEESSWGTR